MKLTIDRISDAKEMTPQPQKNELKVSLEIK